jgi:SAM-dependent methyltransferase
MNNYLKTYYSEEVKPKSDYPEKLVRYLLNTFEMKKGMRILEPGCGCGDHLRLFKDFGLEAYGLDLSPESPLLARDLDISICNVEKEKLPYPDNYFDVVYSKSFLEHLQNPGEFIKEAYRVLKPNGLLLSMTPDWESTHQKFYDDYTHISPFTIVSLENIQLASGYSDVKVYKFRQLPMVWKYPILNNFCAIISPFIPVRTKIPFLRWSRELMLVGSARKPGDV